MLNGVSDNDYLNVGVFLWGIIIFPQLSPLSSIRQQLFQFLTRLYGLLVLEEIIVLTPSILYNVRDFLFEKNLHVTLHLVRTAARLGSSEARMFSGVRSDHRVVCGAGYTNVLNIANRT